MCGIVYVKSFDGKNVNKLVLKQYQAQRLRGTNGFGFYVPKQNRLAHNVRERRIVNLLKRTDAPEILFHHRFPTSTDNVRNACHPFSTHDSFVRNYVLVHNGVIWNSEELQEAHEALGIQYTSMQPDGRFNDSEALLYDIALYLEGKQDQLNAKGDIAFVCIANKDGEADKCYFGRNNNPLRMSMKGGLLKLSSEGIGENIEPDTLYTLDYQTQKITTQTLKIPQYVWHNSGFTYDGYSASSRAANQAWWENELDGYPSDSNVSDRYVSDSLGKTKALQGISVSGSELVGELYDADGVALDQSIAASGETFALNCINDGLTEDEALQWAEQLQNNCLDKVERFHKQLLTLSAGTESYKDVELKLEIAYLDFDIYDSAKEYLKSVILANMDYSRIHQALMPTTN